MVGLSRKTPPKTNELATSFNRKFFIVLAFIGLAAADVSHLTNTYLPPRQSSISYQAPAQVYSSPVVSTYQVQQEIQPQITYSQQPQITYSQVQAPSVEIIDAGYDTGLSGISGNSISGGDSGYYGNSGLISAYDSGISGGLSGGSGYQSVGQVIGGGGYSGGLSGGQLIGGLSGGYSGGSGYQSGGQLIGGGLSGGSIGGGGGGIIRTISAPVISNSYESVGTQYGSNGGYVYERRH